MWMHLTGTYLIKSTDSMNELMIHSCSALTALIFEDMSCNEVDDYDKSSHIGTYPSYLFSSLYIMLHLLSIEIHISHRGVCYDMPNARIASLFLCTI